MKEQNIPVDYAEASILDLSNQITSLRALLANRKFIDAETLEQLVQKNTALQATRLYLSIPCICTTCGHKGFDRLGEHTKCIFCGKDLRFNVKDAQVDTILAPLDATRRSNGPKIWHRA